MDSGTEAVSDSGEAINVLLINHTAAVSGAEVCALDLLAAAPKKVELAVACPEGPLARRARALGIAVHQAPEIEGSFRFDFRETPRAVLQLARAAFRTRALARRMRVDLVHANSLRAGVVAALASKLGAPPALVFVHDCLPSSTLAKVTRKLIRAAATTIVANSAYTARSFDPDAKASVTVVYPPVDLDRFDTARIPRRDARARLGLAPETKVLAVIAQITPWKGQSTAIRSLALLHDEEPRAQLLIVGDAKFRKAGGRHDTTAYLETLRREATALGVEGAVRFLGNRADVPEILRAVDLVLVPSWEEPFGLIIVEAMAMGVPVLATVRGGPPETVTAGQEGLLLEPASPELWAKAAAELLEDPSRRRCMGDHGRRTAKQFSRHRFGEEIAAIYKRTVGRPRPPTRLFHRRLPARSA